MTLNDSEVERICDYTPYKGTIVKLIAMKTFNVITYTVSLSKKGAVDILSMNLVGIERAKEIFKNICKDFEEP